MKIRKGMIVLKKTHNFEFELGWFHDQSIRKFAEYCINELPDYFFTVPASSSGKYHPAYALGDGGLLRHTRAAVIIAHELFNLDMFNFDEEEQDLILLSLLLHDGIKQGDTSKHTVFDHPIYASNFIKKCNIEANILDERQLDIVCCAVESHMGQWCTSKYSKVTLPVPKTKIEKFVHLCDYLASRKFLEVNFNTIY